MNMINKKKLNKFLIIGTNPSLFCTLNKGIIGSNFRILNIPNDSKTLDRIKKISPGLILLDSSLSESACYNILNKLKFDKKFMNTPVLSMASLNDMFNNLGVANSESIIEAMGGGVYAVNNNKRITLLNPIAEKITGWKFEDAQEVPCHEVIKLTNGNGDKNLCEIACPVNAAKKKKKTIHTFKDIFCTNKSGEKIPISNHATAIRNSNGDVTGGVVIFHDMTDEINDLKVTTELVSIASHQLKAPLIGIKWLLEILLRGGSIGNLNSKQRSILCDISNNDKKMISLVSDLLDVSNIETGRKFNIDLKVTNMVPIIKSIIKDHSFEIKNKKINIKLDLPKQRLSLVDKQKVHQSIENIIDNAIKFSKINGSIEIGSKEKNNNKKEIIFYVKDGGCGIPKNQQNRIFEKFFRADNAIAKNSGGTGLGLYIAKAIIEAHNGKIWFKSKINNGSTFYFSLPMKNI